MNEPRPTIALVVAADPNGIIGRDGALPWHIPDDLAWFKHVTLGKAIIMGRKTWDSIGRPLPGRDSIVVTRQTEWQAPGAHRAGSLKEALDLATRLRPQAEEISVIGGADIFTQALPLATRLYWTEVAREYAGDTVFPAFDRSGWRDVSRDAREWGAFVVMERIQK